MSASRKKPNVTFFKDQKSRENGSLKMTWFQQEQKEDAADTRKILDIFWRERIIKYNKKSVDAFKNFIKQSLFENDKKGQDNIEKLFHDCVHGVVRFEIFCKVIQSLGSFCIYQMNEAEKLILSKPIQDLAHSLDQKEIDDMQKYMQDKKMSASITLRTDSGQLITPDFPENKCSSAFAMHSIGKVFTGMLALIMVREGVLSEKDLNRPIQLDESDKMKLSPAVRKQLDKVTLHQAMTHRAGLGDYLGNYVRTIEKGKVPEMKYVEDFLPFVDKEVFSINENRYSNAGILLVGLAIKHAYEQKLGKHCDYNDILKQYIIDEAGMSCFSPWIPKNGKFNLDDKAAQHIVGSPAGGYWTTAEDLAKFGCWIYEKSVTDMQMKKLIEKYGQEFYPDPDRQLIAHGGAIPSSSAYLSVSLKTGAVIAIMSDQPNTAFVLESRIEKNIFDDKSIDITDKEMAESAFGKRSYNTRKS